MTAEITSFSCSVVQWWCSCRYTFYFGT